MLTLSGRTAVIAGANGTVVKTLLENGMNVAMLTHNMAGAQERLASMGELAERCRAVECTVVRDEEVIHAYEQVYADFGSIDVVIPSHGGLPRSLAIGDISGEDFNENLNNIIVGSFNMVKYALPYLEKSRAGRVIFFANAEARMGSAGDSLINSVARGGVISMTYELARRLAEKKITVNCVAKGGIDEKRPPREGEESRESVLSRIPMGYLGSHEDIAAAVSFLASEEAGYITGQVINAAGGMYMG